MHIEIDVRRDASPQIILNKLYTLSQMQITFGIIMLAIVNGEPKILTLKQILQHYIDFQVSVIRRRTEFDLKKASEREHILEGLKTAIDHIDEVIATIRASKDKAGARKNLSEKFGLDDLQTQAIVQMQLGQLTGLERDKIEAERQQLLAKIKEYREILSSYQKQLEIVKNEAMEIRKKFADPRRTQIMSVSGEVDIEDLIPNEECVLTMTTLGYIKRLAVDTYRIQRRGGKGITGMSKREEDNVSDMFVINSHDYVLFFTNFGRVYKLKCYEIPEGSRTAKGMNIANLLAISPDEKVNSIIKVSEFDDSKYLVMVTEKGLIKRIKLNAYNVNRKDGIRAITLNDDDKLSWVKMTDGSSDVLIATKNGVAIRFDENDVRPSGRMSMGVKAITLTDGDTVTGMTVVDENSLVLTVSETGYGRLTSAGDYRKQSRGGRGVINYHTEKYGCVAGISTVDTDKDDIILISSDGIIIRIKADSVNVYSRHSKGVTVMRMNGDAKVVTLAVAPHVDDDTDTIPSENVENTETTESESE